MLYQVTVALYIEAETDEDAVRLADRTLAPIDLDYDIDEDVFQI